MTTNRKTSFITFAVFVFVFATVFAQDNLSGTLILGFGDLTQIKQRAEAGDPAAQVALGQSLAAKFHAAEAHQWYRKAAASGHVEGKYQLGNMLLFGAAGLPAENVVKPNPAEGLRWTFQAATNFHPRACWNMARALQSGLGTSTNLVAAYAWLKLFSETSQGGLMARHEMNQIALRLSGVELQQAENLAKQFKAGRWRIPESLVLPEGDPRLKLGGITLGKTPLAVINGKTLSEGEWAKITVPPGTLKLKCLKIDNDSVTVVIEGEDSPRLLRMK